MTEKDFHATFTRHCGRIGLNHAAEEEPDVFSQPIKSLS
jgi:hypothetical protein